ncbi:MAG: hypothetical protein HT579_11860 [Candidatus Accumulibacter similis]|nr:MAG: hypothetical protein HT579_11860 [Candidatus Accumulibacter similis]
MGQVDRWPKTMNAEGRILGSFGLREAELVSIGLSRFPFPVFLKEKRENGKAGTE